MATAARPVAQPISTSFLLDVSDSKERPIAKVPEEPRYVLALAVTQGNYAGALRRAKRYGEARPIYEDARSGATSSTMLTEWYQKYGAGLCRQAAQRLGIP